MWSRQGLPDLLRDLARDRKFEFDLERAAFAMALPRLCAPGSDLAGSEWVQTYKRLWRVERTFGSRNPPWKCGPSSLRRRRAPTALDGHPLGTNAGT